MNPQVNTLWLWLFGLLLTLNACQTASVKVLPITEPFHILTAKAVMNKLLARKSHLTDLKSFARTTVTRKGTTQTLKQVVLIKDGTTIRIDTLSLFGNPIGVFIHDPYKTLIYDPIQDKTYYGPQVSQSIERVVGSSLDFSETIHLLSGNILDNLKLKSGELVGDRTHYRLETIGPEENDRVFIETDARKLIPTKLEKYNESGLIYLAEWRDYRNIGDYLFAHSVILSRPVLEETLVVTYQKPKINNGLPASAFKLATQSW